MRVLLMGGWFEGAALKLLLGDDFSILSMI